MLSNAIHIALAIDLISSVNSDLTKTTQQMGYAIILSWVSLNSYLTFDEEFAYLPNTLMLSAQRVAQGLIGISPVMFGVAYYSTTVMFYHFKFMDMPNSLMTMFYIMNGDTLFDTVEGIE